MAVDTRNKRASVIGFAFVAALALPLADASVDTEDRLILSQEYAGLEVNVVSGSASSAINAIAQSSTGSYGPSGAATSAISEVGSAATGAVEVTGAAVSVVSGIGMAATGIGGEVSDPLVPTGRSSTRRGTFTDKQRLGSFSRRTRRGSFT